MDIDAHQGLDDVIMQLAADALSFLFLRVQNLMGQVPQLFLHVTRLLQQPVLVLLAFLEGLLHPLPPGNLPVQPPVGVGQGLQAALHLLSPFAGSNVPERDPAPFPRPRGADCGRGPKADPKSASALLQK